MTNSSMQLYNYLSTLSPVSFGKLFIEKTDMILFLGMRLRTSKIIKAAHVSQSVRRPNSI